jgi:hypothetical protein
MSVGSAARALGETRLATLTRIVKGELIGQHVGGQTFVRRDTLEALVQVLAAHAGTAQV